MAQAQRSESRLRRHARVREKIRGTTARPRLAVYRSITHIYGQLIDDTTGRTVAAASEATLGGSAGAGEAGARRTKVQLAALVGAALAEKAKAAGVADAVFDRGGYRYHGRVKAFAEAARQGGLKF